jgi:predicted NUDIX family NTP pyrophosphohydrolase
MDTQFITWYTGKTALQLLLAVPDGNSGTSRQHIAWYVPKCKIDTAPQPIESGGRRLYDISLSSRIDTSASGLLAAPALFAVG